MNPETEAVIREAVAAGDSGLLRESARRYRGGDGVEKDLDTAIEFDRALYSLDGKGAAQFYDDLRKRHGAEDIRESVKVLFGKDGNGSDMKHRRATAYLNGLSIDRDIEKGLALTRSLSKGEARDRFLFIDSVVKFKAEGHYPEVFEECSSMAERDADAIPRLAAMYRDGIGTGADPMKASRLFLTAGDVLKAIDCLISMCSAEGDEEAARLLDSMSDSPERDSRFALLDFRVNGPSEVNIGMMRSAAVSRKPWAAEMMNGMFTTDPGWNFEVCSVFACMADKETSLKVLSKLPKDASKAGVQEAETDLLRNLVKCCDDLGIDVMVDGGTLLGAVRHSGFIPWDDDVDVRMFEDDIITLKDYLSVSSTDYFVIEAYAYGRLYKFYSVNHGGWIDIFPLQSQVFHGDSFEVVGRRVSPGDDVTDMYIRVARDSQPLASHSYFREEDIYPLRRMRFGDIEVPVPQDTDKVLTSYYGKYYLLPDSQGIHNQDHTNEWIANSFKRSKDLSPEEKVKRVLRVADKYSDIGDTEHQRLWLMKAASLKGCMGLYSEIEKGGKDLSGYASRIMESDGKHHTKVSDGPVAIPEDPKDIVRRYDSLVSENTPESLAESYRLLCSIPDDLKAGFLCLFGKTFHKGLGTEVDLTRSADCFRRASEKPVWAQLEFFDVLRAIGTEDSYREMVQVARDNIQGRKCSEWMMGRLGNAYLEGRGVPMDMEKARYWLTKAAEKGVPWARSKLDAIGR